MVNEKEVLISWKAGDTITSWGDLCGLVIDRFGLPGYKYKTELTADWMSFKFVNEKDALMCKLMLSEHL